MGKIKKIVRILVPSSLLRGKLHTLHEYYLIISARYRHQKALRKLKGKPKIKVAFFVLHSSVWKCDELYKKMDAEDKFQPIIIICPYMPYGEDIMQREMTDAYNLFYQKRYNVINAYNPDTFKWLDVKREINPDIVFFTNPHGLSRQEYNITNFLNYLTCYIPYTYQVTYMYNLQYDQLFHNLLWKAFYQTPIHKGFAINYARNRGRNVMVSGYPGIDVFQDESYLPEDRWKNKNRNLKRIIWAPHHSIGDDKLSFSNFFKYHMVMLDIAEKLSERIQIAFKPHPILKAKLILEKDWGKEKTTEYYLKWNDLSNGQLEESDYVDIFMTSDAMIHDCDSFMAEYIAVNKPVLFIVRDSKITERFNNFGKLAFDQHYKAHSKDDIIDFIKNIVINGNDVMKNQRELFYKSYMIPPGGTSATNNIFNEIQREIKLKS